MEWKELIPWIVVVIIIVLYALKDYNTNKKVLAAFTESLVAVRSDPVALTNAKAAAESVPQEAFNGLYELMNGILVFVNGTALGDLLHEAKEDVELVDHDPTNDPITPRTVPPGDGIPG